MSPTHSNNEITKGCQEKNGTLLVKTCSKCLYEIERLNQDCYIFAWFLLKNKNMNWFECKVSYEKIEGGVPKKASESYLVDALSFTEAEARIIEELRPMISGEFTISNIKRARIAELFFNENGDRYYKFKILYITLDEKSGAEKKTPMQMLAQACDVKEAIAILEEGMKGSMSDYEIASVSDTPIMDVFPFSAGK